MTIQTRGPNAASAAAGASLKAKYDPAAAQPSEPGQPQPQTTVAPTFGPAEVRACIPAHLFERSFIKSFGHLMLDVVKAAVLYYCSTYISAPSTPTWVAVIAWPVYWWLQGCVFTGLWVMGHECGHQAFSDSAWVNDIFGLIIHTFVLVPYHPWRVSHAQHHKYTCSMENDEVFVPVTRSEIVGEITEDTPIVVLAKLLSMLVFGWPMYLIKNATGPAKYRGKKNSHFTTDSALYKPRDATFIVVSLIGLGIMVSLIAMYIAVFGVWNWVAVYFIPYLITNGFLVLITFLQHSDTYIPHYREGEFTWLRGALATVDRDYGWWCNYQLHHIMDSHVAHHLFSTMPFYNAVQATPYLKKFLGKYYLYDDTPIVKAAMRAYSKCLFVEDEGQVLFFKNK